MTESFRRSGEYENPYQGQQQHSGYAQGETRQQPAYLQQQPASAPVNPEWPPPPAYEPASATASAGPGTAGTGTGTAAGTVTAPASRRRSRGPIALVAAVAFVAAAIGGGT